MGDFNKYPTLTKIKENDIKVNNIIDQTHFTNISPKTVEIYSS